MTMSSSQANFISALLGACRTLGLVAFLFVTTASVLGVAVSVHMAQVFERVTNLHATALPSPMGGRLLLASNSL